MHPRRPGAAHPWFDPRAAADRDPRPRADGRRATGADMLRPATRVRPRAPLSPAPPGGPPRRRPGAGAAPARARATTTRRPTAHRPGPGWHGRASVYSQLCTSPVRSWVRCTRSAPLLSTGCTYSHYVRSKLQHARSDASSPAQPGTGLFSPHSSSHPASRRGTLFIHT